MHIKEDLNLGSYHNVLYIIGKKKENRDYALKYLFEEVINIKDDDFVERYDANLFIENDYLDY